MIFARDKVVVTAPDGRTHLTMHLGSYSGVLDLHETHVATDGSKTYKRLFTISHENLGLFLRDLAPDLWACLNDLLRPLRVGWMARRRVAAVVGLPPSDSDFEKVTDVRHRKLVVNTAKLLAQATHPEFLEELYNLADGDSFMLFDVRKTGTPRQIGIGLKYSDPLGRPHLMWYRFSGAAKTASRLTPRFIEVAARYGQFHQPLPWLDTVELETVQRR